MSDEKEETESESKKLAEEHWQWMQSFVGSWASLWFKLVELNYTEGFIHGYKHGQESNNDTLEKQVCDLHNKMVDMENKEKEKVKR